MGGMVHFDLIKLVPGRFFFNYDSLKFSFLGSFGIFSLAHAEGQ
jgi:hypothetical protein